ncbi:Phage regulatory protein Rha [anaerobic digester metagenome]
MGKLPESFCRLNFEPADIEVLVPASGGLRKDPAYLLTRDAFTLLVMGWSSARAMEWKLRYIEAFNALERAAMENARAEARIEGALGFMALSQEQRNDLEKAIYYRNKGLSFEDVAKLLDRSRDYVWRLLRRAVDLGLADAGLIAPLPKHQRLDAGRPACPVASREGA